MLEIGPQHTLDYRHEVLKPFFDYVRSSESFSVIGAASMGKTRLLDFLMKPEVKEHYLSADASRFWLIRVDLNRLVKEETWAFYELLLSSILLDLYNHESIGNLNTEIAQLDSEVIQKRDFLLSLRFFEMAVNRLCQVYELRLCFLFDEFDEAYQTLPKDLFRQLRAVRDANKNRVSFGLFLRNLPDVLRSPSDNESFYELLSRNLIGLGPYNRADTLRILEQIEARRQYRLSPEMRERFLEASGGHAGILQGLLSAIMENPQFFPASNGPGWTDWVSQQPGVREECRKIYEGLREEEQAALRAFARGEFSQITPLTGKSLMVKGVLRRDNSETRFFSRVFESYVRSFL
ncbi:MAG: hypothetical protein ACM3Y8_11175 [Byssovorax cruenta]